MGGGPGGETGGSFYGIGLSHDKTGESEIDHPTYPRSEQKRGLGGGFEPPCEGYFPGGSGVPRDPQPVAAGGKGKLVDVLKIVKSAGAGVDEDRAATACGITIKCEIEIDEGIRY